MVKIILICSLFFASCAYKDIYRKVYIAYNFLYMYENYEDNGYLLADSFCQSPLFFSQQNLLPKEPYLDVRKGVNYHKAGDIKKLSSYYEITGEFRNWLLFQFPVSLGDLPPITHADSIALLESYKSDYIVFLGHLKENNPYQSFLILVDRAKDDMFLTIKTLIRINHINGKVTSLSMIANEVWEGDELIKGWTEKEGKKYVYKRLYDSSLQLLTPCVIREMLKNGEKVDIDILYTSYSVDDSGRIHIIKH